MDVIEAMETCSATRYLRPDPVPPGLISPNIMLTIAAPPLSGNRLSCWQLTAPSEVLVVEPPK